VLLMLMPAVHKTSRQIAYGFPSLARDDIAQQLFTSILDILQSKPLLKQQSHFAFTITRLMRRHSFRWAIREAKLAPPQELAAPVLAEAVIEAGIGFETAIHLQEFLRGCLSDGQLTETEYDLLMLFKIEGLSVEVLAAREGLSEIAFRHRIQRVIDRLRRIAQSHSLSTKRRAASATRRTAAPSRTAGRRISAA
jgi:DNA-directed RNA polymerase specialized sigma24 family protein